MAASEKHAVLQFTPNPSSSTTVSARVHPLVILNICDCYFRRPDGADRVIGTLLGSVLPDGTVDIRNSYAVPHSEASNQCLKATVKGRKHEDLKQQWLVDHSATLCSGVAEIDGYADTVTCIQGPCFLKKKNCPHECPLKDPTEPKAKVCYMNCNSLVCKPECKSRKLNCNAPGAACLDPHFIGGYCIVVYFHG